jgi:hypothetical protein
MCCRWPTGGIHRVPCFRLPGSNGETMSDATVYQRLNFGDLP